MKNKILLTFFIAFICFKGFSQVSVTGTPYGCTSPSDTLTAHLVGDIPINSGITEDDIYTTLIPIGFTFNFYGTNYTNLVIGANGDLNFTASLAGAYDPWPITAALLGNSSVFNGICGPWCDIDIFYTGSPIGTETYSTDGVAPNRKFSVTWCGCSMYSCPSQLTTTQIILYEATNIIEVHITQKLVCAGWNGGYAIVGVQNAAGTAATAAPGRDYPTDWSVPPHEAWRFTPVGGGASYSVAPIPYAPIPYSTSSVYWYDSTTGAYLGTGLTLVVTPSVTTTYKAGALGCADTSFGYYTVVVAPAPHIDSATFTSPTACGICNGTITLYGINPRFTDTLDYKLDGAWVTQIVTVAATDSTVTFTGLCGGIYSDFSIKVGGCTDTLWDTLKLISPPISFSGFANTNPSICGACDATISLLGLVPGTSDTITYLYNGVLQPPIVVVPGSSGTAVITGLCDGSYTDFKVRVGYCIDSNNGPVNIIDPPFFISSFSNTNPSVCGACDATITLDGLVPGTSDTVNYTLGGVPQPPVIQLVSSIGTIVLTGLCAGTYSTITVKMNDCITAPVGPINIINPPFVITGFAHTNTTCGECNGTITLVGMTPSQTISINYNFNGVAQPSVAATTDAFGTTVISNLCPGLYENITATLNTCVAGPVGPITIVAPPVIPIFLITTTNPTGCGMCNGTIKILGMPPSSIDTVFYTYNDTVRTAIYAAGADSTVTIYGLCGGTYDSVWMKTGNCPSDTINQIILTPPVITHGFSEAIHYGCVHDSVFFTNSSVSLPTGSLTYEWDFGDITTDTFTNPVHIYQTLGTYTVIQTVTNNFCTYYDTMVISLNNSMNVSFSATPDTICQGSSVTFNNTSTSGMGALTYIWNYGDKNADITGSPTHVYPNSGTYTVTLVGTNFVPCSDTATEIVQVDTISQIRLAVSDTTICQHTFITFTSIYAALGNVGIIWSFDNGDTIRNQNPVSYSFSDPGVFTVTSVSLYRACADISNATIIRVYPQPSIYIGADTTICPGSSPITLIDYANDGNPIAKWLWSTGATGPSIGVVAPGHYWAMVSINNCWATDSVWIRNGCYMNIPNIFSPNNDGVNDYFYPRQQLAQGLVSFTMNIYNRWGQLVFTTSSLDGAGWDGKFNDTPQPEDVYIYMIEATFIDGQKEHHQGNITLLR